MVYLDYAANAPVDEEVLDVYYETSKKYFANPNAEHRLGKEAKTIIDKSTEEIAKTLRILPEVISFRGKFPNDGRIYLFGLNLKVLR